MEYTQTENRSRKCFYLLTSRLKLFDLRNLKLFSLLIFNFRDGDLVLTKEETADEIRRLSAEVRKGV